MSNIEWGPEIAVDGKRPAWLTDLEPVRIGWTRADGPLWSDPGAWNAKQVAEDTYDGRTWKNVTAIRLPADHPHYQQTQPLDWSAPIEAVHEDGRVVPVHFTPWNGFRGNIGKPDKQGDYYTSDPEGRAGHSGIWLPDGSAWSKSLRGWRIRNVATKPVRTAAEMLERMEALTRRMAEDHKPGVHYVTQMEPLRDEARAIVAEMTPPSDSDLIEAERYLANAGWEDAGQRRTGNRASVAEWIAWGIKRGRELERGA